MNFIFIAITYIYAFTLNSMIESKSCNINIPLHYNSSTINDNDKQFSIKMNNNCSNKLIGGNNIILNSCNENNNIFNTDQLANNINNRYVKMKETAFIKIFILLNCMLILTCFIRIFLNKRYSNNHRGIKNNLFSNEEKIFNSNITVVDIRNKLFKEYKLKEILNKYPIRKSKLNN